MITFSSKIFIIGVNPYVPVPESVLAGLFAQAKKKQGPIPVRGKLNGKPFTQTVVKYAGIWRLYLNGIMRNAAGIDVGDIVQVAIEFDNRPREEKMPGRLAELLAEDRKSAEVFETFPPYRKKEILRYLNSLKSDETRDRNIEKVMKHLRGEKIEGLIAVTYRKSTRLMPPTKKEQEKKPKKK